MPEIRKRKLWFAYYLLVSIFYAEFKNLIQRVAQIKQAMGEREWRITARSREETSQKETNGG